MKFVSSKVAVHLFVSIIVGRAVIISSNPISPSTFPRVEPGTQDFNEVANNAHCPFSFKVIEIWLTKHSNISIVQITCKKSSNRSSNRDGDKRCIQLTSPLILDWNVSSTVDGKRIKWSRIINSGCVYSEVNDRSQPGNIVPN